MDNLNSNLLRAIEIISRKNEKIISIEEENHPVYNYVTSRYVKKQINLEDEEKIIETTLKTLKETL